MNKEEKFLNYLEGLKTSGNVELLENISEGFKTLVEYRVNGSIEERSVDIMENSEDIEDMASNMPIDDPVAEDPESVEENKLGDLDTPLDESSQTATIDEDVEIDDPDETAMMEVGEGDVKGKLTPSLLRAVDDTVEGKIRKMASMIDKQKLVPNDEHKIKYLKHMRGQLWREELLSHGVNPDQAKGLMPAMNESVEEADNKLLDFIDSAFKLFQIAKPE